MHTPDCRSKNNVQWYTLVPGQKEMIKHKTRPEVKWNVRILLLVLHSLMINVNTLEGQVHEELKSSPAAAQATIKSLFS